MDYITKALDLYNEALQKGFADVNGKLKSSAEKTIEEYEAQIEAINGDIDKSKGYIKSLQTRKVNASKEEKAYINSLIAIERESIYQMQTQIKEIKSAISSAKANLKELVEKEDLIEKGLKGALDGLEDEDKNLVYSYNLWYERTGENLSKDKVKEEQANLLNKRLEVQAQKILEIKDAYDELVESYGNTNEASVAMENQLLSECVTYEKLKDSISDLKEVEQYSQEQINNTIYDMNEYLKNNYSKLKEAGFSDEVIYSAARGSSGYDKYLESVNNKKKAVPEENDIVNEAETVVEGLSERFSVVTTNFASNVESTVSSLVNSVSDILRTTLSQAAQEIRKNVNSVQNNNVTNNYTVNSSGGEGFIHNSINALKNFEALKKARGV